MFDVGQFIADRYKLLKQLGRGGFSEVWLAEDKLTGIQVAVKIYAPGMGLDDAGISMFTQEFSLVFDMNHTNLLHPTYYDCWERMPYLILPFCKNGSAFKYLKEDNQITEEEAWNLLHDVSAGLAYLHGKNPPVIHQDIKPDNILISDENHYMITDFGISARIRSTFRRSKGQEMSGGTLAYMGPERFSQTPAPIMASDIWSLGAMMFELMTGNTPFGDHGGILQKSGAEIPIIETDYSEELKEMVYKCLAPNTWDRPTAKQIADYTYQYLNGAQELSDVQEEVSQVQSANAPEPELEPQGEQKVPEPQKDHEPQKELKDLKDSIEDKPKGNKKKLIIAAAVVVVFIIIGCILLFSGEKEPEPLPEPVEEIDYNAMCKLIIEEGYEEERHGEEYRFQMDSIVGGSESVFEDYYINAYNKYKRIDYYRDSISVSVYLDAQKRIETTTTALDSAYHAMKDMAETMKKFKQDVEAEMFESRANKIGSTINIKENEDDE